MTTLQTPPIVSLPPSTRPTRESKQSLPTGRGKTSFSIVAALIATAVTLLVLYPMVRMLLQVFFADGHFNSAAFSDAWNQPGIVQTLVNTAIAIGVSGFLALIIGSFFAWLSERTDASMGWATDVLPVVPMLVPPVAMAIGWVFLGAERAGFLNVVLRSLLSRVGVNLQTGPFNIFTWYGLLFVYTLFFIPYIFLAVSSALRSLDPALEEASRVSGAGPWRTLWKVTLPAVRPSMASAFLIVLMLGFALFSIPVVIGTTARIDVLSVRMIRLVLEHPSRADVAMVVGIVVLASIGSAWMAQLRLRRRAHHATITGRATRASKVELGALRWPARGLIVAYLLSTTILPFLALLIVAMQPFWSADIVWSRLTFRFLNEVIFQTRVSRDALTNSVILASVTATAVMSVSAILMFWAKQRRGRIGSAVDGVMKLPSAVSHILIGVAFVVALSGPPFSLAGTSLILILAFVVVNLPQGSTVAGTALDQVGGELVEASFVSGGGQWRTFLRVALPLMMPGLIAGWALVFVLAVGDLSVAAMLASTKTPVAGFVILDYYQTGSYARVASLAIAITVLSTVVVSVSMVWNRRRSKRRTRG